MHGELIDRMYRDFLHRADDQPVVLTLSAGVDGPSNAGAYFGGGSVMVTVWPTRST